MARWLVLTLLCLLLWPLNAASQTGASPYAVNESMPQRSFPDQHDREGAITTATRNLLFAPDRKAGELLQDSLKAVPAARLEATGTICLADISRMPSLVARFIAIPRMRDLPYRLLLARNEEATLRFPRQPGQLTWVRLDRLRITEITFLAHTEQLATRLAAETSGEDPDDQPLAPRSQ